MTVLADTLGPLAALAGVWEGDKGSDTAPADDRGIELNPYRERLTLVPIDVVNNHEQVLYGLRYTTTVWRLADGGAFHEECGYWLWDAAERQVTKCFVIPRGVTVIAGATVDPEATAFELVAVLGSPTYGIASNPFLDREFCTVRYELRVTVHDASSFSYEEDTVLRMKGREALFHHVDRNTLRRVG